MEMPVVCFLSFFLFARSRHSDAAAAAAALLPPRPITQLQSGSRSMVRIEVSQSWIGLVAGDSRCWDARLLGKKAGCWEAIVLTSFCSGLFHVQPVLLASSSNHSFGALQGSSRADVEPSRPPPMR